MEKEIVQRLQRLVKSVSEEQNGTTRTAEAVKLLTAIAKEFHIPIIVGGKPHAANTEYAGYHVDDLEGLTRKERRVEHAVIYFSDYDQARNLTKEKG